MKKDFLIGTFEDDIPVMAATKKARDRNISIYDIYTPFPVHGLDEAMGIKRSILPYVTLVAGLVGLLCGVALQVWTNGMDWPVIVGGKPPTALPAFVPIMFELTILFGAHTTVAGFLFLTNLYPGKKALVFDQDQTCHKFVMAFDKSTVNVEEVSNLLKEFGAMEIREQSAEI